MQIIAVISGKGGVGKTTVAANLAVALSQKRKRVLLIDLDMQNALRLHLGMAPDDVTGIVHDGISRKTMFKSQFGVKCIPFGVVHKAELEEFEAGLKLQPSWVSNQISTLNKRAFDFVIIDTPPGPSVYLQQALAAANYALGVVLADAASFATVPRLVQLVEQYTRASEDFHDFKLVINQLSARSELADQMCQAIQSDYGQYLVPLSVHSAQAVSEALACGRPVLKYDAVCEASRDIQCVADWLMLHFQP